MEPTRGQSLEKGQQGGVGLDQIRHFSPHRTLATTLIYRDEHDKAATQRTLADVVAGALAHLHTARPIPREHSGSLPRHSRVTERYAGLGEADIGQRVHHLQHLIE